MRGLIERVRGLSPLKMAGWAGAVAGATFVLLASAILLFGSGKRNVELPEKHTSSPFSARNDRLDLPPQAKEKSDLLIDIVPKSDSSWRQPPLTRQFNVGEPSQGSQPETMSMPSSTTSESQMNDPTHGEESGPIDLIAPNLYEDIAPVSPGQSALPDVRG